LTTLVRLKSSALTGGVGNALLATFELFGAFGVALVAVLVPVVSLVLVAAILAVAIRRLGPHSRTQAQTRSTRKKEGRTSREARPPIFRT